MQRAGRKEEKNHPKNSKVKKKNCKYIAHSLICRLIWVCKKKSQYLSSIYMYISA